MVCSKVVTVVFGAMLATALVRVGPAGAREIVAHAQTEPPATGEMLPAAQPRGRAYLFRGALGPIFSRGMDRLTKQIKEAGVDADVNEFTICRLVAQRAITAYREDPAPIILIGHSMGGYCTIIFSQMLENEKIPVSLVVTIDPAHVTPEVPLNVERFINIFLSKDVLGGGDVKPQRGYRGHYASFDLSLHTEVSHITIDKMDGVHRQLVAKIVQLTTTPTKDQGEPVPLRYVVPADAAIDLWDSGAPFFARQQETMQNIATLFRVPLWSLTQVNKGADNAPLIQGERIVVPRHLLPLAAESGQPSMRR